VILSLVDSLYGVGTDVLLFGWLISYLLNGWEVLLSGVEVVNSHLIHRYIHYWTLRPLYSTILEVRLPH
jgi:hypothetical protein